jgi:hypothetical protein
VVAEGRLSLAGIALVCLAGCDRGPPLPPNVDRRAVQLLDEMERKLSSAPTLEAAGLVERRNPQGEVQSQSWQRCRFVRPERLLVTVDSSKARLGSGKMTEATSSIQSFDGTSEMTWWSGSDVVRKFAQDEAPRFPFAVLSPAYRHGAKHFWPGEWSSGRIHDLTLKSLDYVGREKWNGDELDVVRWVTRGGYFAPEQDFTDTAYIYLADDRTPRRLRVVTSRGSSTDEQITRLTLGGPLTEEDATYTPPAAMKVDTNYMAMVYNPEKKPYLDYVGRTFPQFVVPVAQGGEFNLSDQRVKRRYTMVYIWFYG